MADGRNRQDFQWVSAAIRRSARNLTLVAPGRPPLSVGRRPGAARIVLSSDAPLRAFRKGDHLALAEAYLAGEIDLEGDLSEILALTDLLSLEATPLARVRHRLALSRRRRRAVDRASIAFHYDRPAAFFLPWLDRWRSYSHGFYASDEDDPAEAQARKMQYAVDALGLRPGMRVLDMGGGWGCFVEYAGLQGIRVESITISKEQFRFVEELILRRSLPCSVEFVDFFDHEPRAPYDAVVFMGTLEHVLDYPRVARFLERHLRPEGGVYADFCAQRSSFQVGGFMRRHLWPGAAGYVEVPALLDSLVRAGFNVHALEDDTRSYALTVRDWARQLEAAREDLAKRFGEREVRTFLLFLWGSYHFLRSNRTQAYHLVASRVPAPLRSTSPDRA